MTGFATRTLSLPFGNDEHCTLEVEIKTFNSRFFEATCKLPFPLQTYELSINQMLKKHLIRGRVYCTIKQIGNANGMERYVFSPARVNEYLLAAQELREKFGMTGDLDVYQMLSLPGIFTAERNDFTPEMKSFFLEEVERTIEEVVVSRKEEGARLVQDLEKRFEKTFELMQEIQTASHLILTEKKEQLAQEIARMGEGDEGAKAPLKDQYAALDKMDVHEEIIRFFSHLKAMQDHLSYDSVEKGRKCDFILQELMRETNTIAAKCSGYAVSSMAVDIKVELEKAREQVQNIV